MTRLHNCFKRRRFMPGFEGITILVSVLVVALIAGGVAGSAMPQSAPITSRVSDARARQDSTPAADDDPADVQGTPATAEVTEEEPAAFAVATSDEEFSNDQPTGGVVAHGLAYWEGGDVVWRVRQVELPPEDSAPTEASAYYGFIVQRVGQSIIRNDVTGKRALMEPGESYYVSADDPYTRMAYADSDSTVWIIELTEPGAEVADETGGEVFFETEAVSLDEGTYDAELTRVVLLPGQTGRIVGANGPVLVMGSYGSAEIDVTGNVSMIGPGAGFTVTQDAVVNNTSNDLMIYYTAALPEAVGETTPATTAGTPGAGATPQASTTTPGEVPSLGPDDGGTDSDGDFLTDGQEAEIGTDPFVFDTDGDNLDDGSEFDYGTDPLSADTDGDGAADGDEIFTYFTDPLTADGDGDGLLDGAEVFDYGTDPFTFDTDFDGFGDGDEINAGSDPFDPNSTP
jgi:hypothetical protein